MHPRRKSKNSTADHEIYVEVMEPRVLLSADALGVDSSVFDRELQTQSDWDLTVATDWWVCDAEDTTHSDAGDPTAEIPSLSVLYSIDLQELSNNGLSPSGEDLDEIELSSSPGDKQTLYRELVFLDAGVIDGEQLLSDLLRNTDTATTQVYLIDSNSDGVEQISSVLNSHQNLDAVHIISHGAAGQVQLGSGTLSSRNVESYSDQLNLWGSSLAESGDILIYGCDLASDSEGQSLVAVISAMTRADIAASVDQTGNTEQGGDWELEYQRGDVETAALASSLTQDWTGILALVNVTTFDDIADGGDTTDIDSLIATPGTDGISLREAIIATNNDAGQADTITLSAGTYSLALAGAGEDVAATGDLDILDALTITGAGADQTFIDAAGLDRVFQVIAGSEFNVSISDLAIQNGLVDNRGAGIHIGNLPAAPVVTLDNVWFSGNHTTGTTDFGGAIFNRGELTVVDSLIEGNSSEFGGGVMNFTNGTLTMTNTTISGNSATAGDGGGLYNLSVATLLNVTVADNSASGDGGGLYNKDAAGAITNINNTLVANNTASSSPDINGAFVSNGGNLVKTPGSVTGLQAGDIQGNDPRLTPLGDYGGMTQTHALQAGSLAINPGTVTGEPAADQRGILRDAQADIGAFEATANILIVDTLSNAADAPNAATINNLLSNIGADGKISLSEAIMATNGTANMIGGPDEIRFEITDALVGGAHTINVAAGGLPTITEAVIIDGTTDADYVDSPIIELNGVAAASNGLNITGDGSTIRGLLINNFNSGHGIEIIGDNNRIESSYVGIDVTGNTDLGNAHLGIRINSASGNYIGGAGVGNVISGNGWAGIAVVGSASDNNFIQGNLIGTNAAGTGAIGNGNYGIDIWTGGPSNTTIGGVSADLRNVISGNLWAGIHISGTTATGNQVLGNYIGTDITGTAAIANGTGSASNGGIDIDGGANANTIGGSVGGAGNLIAYNTGPGVRVDGATALGNTIQENAIHSNTGIGIDLVSVGNQARQAPLMTTITTDGAGLVAIDGSYSDPAITSQALSIEYFSNQSNANEGRVYLDSGSFTTDGSGNASFSSGVSALVTDGEYVTATVTDSSGNTSEFSLGQVAVLAVNNAPTFLSSGPFNVDEGAMATTVVGNVDADNGDGGAADADIIYSITSNVNPDSDGNNAFTIDSSSGQITVNDTGDLDFEGTTPLVITVQADDGVLTSSTSVTVNLNDVAPALTATGAMNTHAGQTYLLDLTATEPGSSGITTYTVNWGDGNISTEAYTGPTTTVSHVYNNVGFTYQITFAANDVSDTWTASDLIVANYIGGTDDVFVFDGNSGNVDSMFDASGGDLKKPYGIAVGPDGNVYIAGYDSNNIVRYAADGSYLGVFNAHGQLNQPTGLAWGSDGNLYVSNYGANNILRIDAAGTFIDVWGNGGALDGPEALVFSPDGDLYVSSWVNKKIVMFDGDLGGSATTVINSGLDNPEQIIFDGAGDLYIANADNNEILRWDGATLSSYFTHAELDFASGLAFGPDGQLYVSSHDNDKILRYDGAVGEVFADDGPGGLDKPLHLAFVPDHQVTIAANDAPVATGNTVLTTENHSLVIDASDFNFTDTESDSLTSVTVTGLNLNGGTLSHSAGAVTVTNGMTISVTQLADLIFTPALNDSTDSSFSYTANDGGLGVTPAVMNITVDAASYYLDNFNTAAFNNSNGSINWSAMSWLEANDDANPSSGDIQISGNALVLQESDGNTVDISRAVDLSSATTAFFEFNYSVSSDTGPASVSVEVWDGSVWNVISSYDLTVEVGLSHESFDISAHMDAASEIKFVIASDFGTSAAFNIDNVKVMLDPTANNAPSASNLSSTSSYSEGVANVAITDIEVSDVDVAEIITASLTLANTSTGSLSVNDGASYTSGTGVWSITDTVANVNTALANLAFSPTVNNDVDTSININIDDGDEDASGALTGTITLDVTPTISGAVSTHVPGAQNTNEDTTLVFSTGIGNAIIVDDGTAGDSVLRTELSVTNGTLKLGTLAGLSFESGADGTSSMIIIGLESAINTALDGLIFTPSPDYEGLANLQLTTDSQADLQGHYTFTQPGALGADTSPAGANAGAESSAGVAPDPSAVWDNSRGSDVLLLDGVDDNIQISGRFGTPTNLTLAAWVNVTAANNQEVISIGGSIALRLNDSNSGIGVTGFFNDGISWNHTNSNQFIGDDGWRHVAYTFDDTNNTQVIYIDGVALTTSLWTGSINWAHQSNSTIGSHAEGASYWLDGIVDDMRIYDQALTAGQIEALSRDTAKVSITVEPTNDAPQAINLTSNSAYVEGDASVPIIDIVLSDVDAGEAISATLTLANTATGSLSANNGATYTVGTGVWTISDTVANVNAALANVEFNPATDNDLDTTIGIDIDDGDEDASGALTGTITLDVTPENDTAVLAINTGVTVDESSTGTVIDNTQLNTSDVDNTALQLVYSITDPTDNGSLRLSGAALNLSNSFTQHDIDNNRITYDHDGSETIADSFDFSVVDVVGAVSTGTFSITVTPQNDEQEITNNTGTSVNEGSAGLVLSTGMLETTDVDNVPNQLSYTLTSEPGNGTLKLNGNPLMLNDTFTQDEIDQGEVTYDHGGSEAPDDSFGFSVDDGAGNASTGIFVIDVQPQNDEQIIALSTGATVDEGSIVNAIGSTQLSTTDTDHNATDLVYRVTAVTEHGVLKLGDTELSLSDSFTQEQINSGELTYDHDGSETTNDSFNFSVDDGVGSNSLGTFSFSITAQNDEQQLITNSGTTINGGSSGSVISVAMLAATDVDNTAAELVYKVVAIPSNGTLKLSGNALALYDTFTQDDIDNNRITYDHDGSLAISDSFGFSVDDGVGSASTGSFNIAVERESLIPQTINPVGYKISTEGIASNVQLASSVETIQSASVPTDELEVESESKSNTDISIDEEQTDTIVTVADIRYQFTTANSMASTNAAASSPQVTLIARLLQTPAIAGLLAAPYEFDALSLEINQILTSYEFNESMDSLRKDLDDSKFLRGAVVGSSVAVTTGLSVGYVAWMVRGGVLLSSVLSSLPAWQFIDPLPVLNFSEKEEEGDEQDDSLEDIIADHANGTDGDSVSDSHEKSIIPADSKETR